MKTKPEDMTEMEFETQRPPVMGYALTLLLFLLAVSVIGLLCASCAATTLYGRDGAPLARFQGDMQTVAFDAGADGSLKLTAAAINHSKATQAGGVAVAKGILATGTAVATSGIVTVIK
jgi:hypothetical protein